ncbi:M20/M25/M40 family metallo-hydrolase [Enterorhabdus sp. P55]|uniref:M20/M25/M40 family metallo-hydrolase n=1 Tax=Enterorhabdus sp. P55 TaxID=2304571 RepID=UPI00136D7F17|nr:M20/M25/M40 family metallo-hydrolase [Enterorhabdus sp. P55]NBI32124.1 M20/M25/M40 family metallo-hydrolase [Enterorhabdus sp. P55]
MNSDRLLSTFLELVAVESPSFCEAAMASHCARALAELGFFVEFDASAVVTGSDSGNLIARLPGTAPGRLALSAHLDTVEPCAGIEVLREAVPAAVLGSAYADEGATLEVLRSAGETILSADDKAGIAAILEGVRSTLESGAPRPDLTVLLTTCEEQSLLGSSALAPDALSWPVDLPSACAGAGAAGARGEGRAEGGAVAEGAGVAGAVVAGDEALPCYVLDADGRPGTIITGAPCHWTMRARFHGRAAHAGVEPEAGVSAIALAADAVAAMPLGRLDECTTANVGVIAGGTAVNVVPEACELAGECRSLRPDRAAAQRDAMTVACEQAAAQGGGSVELEWTCDYPAVLFEDDAPVVARAVAAARAAGLVPRLARTGGGADANVLGAKGCQAVTLGIGMANFHSADEFIAVRDLEATARLVEALIAEYAG